MININNYEKVWDLEDNIENKEQVMIWYDINNYESLGLEDNIENKEEVVIWYEVLKINNNNM